VNKIGRSVSTERSREHEKKVAASRSRAGISKKNPEGIYYYQPRRKKNGIRRKLIR
jgi:hypothetical protein